MFSVNSAAAETISASHELITAASIEAMMPFAFPELDTPEAATLTLQAEKELWVARGDEGIGKIYPEAFAKGWEQMAAANLSDPDMDPSVAYTTAISDQL